MAKVHRSKRKAVDYLYEQDLLSLGKTEPREAYKEVLDNVLESNRVRKGASPKENTVYITRKQNYDIHHDVSWPAVNFIREFDFPKGLKPALDKTLQHYPARKGKTLIR